MVRRHSRSARLICTADSLGFSVVTATAVFVVMIILMNYSGPPHSAVSFDLPRVRHAVTMRRANREDAIVISITRDGKVYLTSNSFSPDKLPIAIRLRVASGSERKAYLKVDRHARYGDVMMVLVEVRSAGLDRISFLVEEVSTTQDLEATGTSFFP